MAKMLARRRKVLPAARNVPARVADKAPVAKPADSVKPARTGLINRT